MGSNKPNTPEQLQEAVDLIAQHGGSAHRASLASGIPSATLRARYSKGIAQGMTSDVVPEGYRVSGTSTLINHKGETIVQWIKTREDKQRLYEAMRCIAEELKEEIPRVKRRPARKFQKASDYLNLINIGDAHIGSYIWDEECNGESFDISIAKRDLCTAMDYLIDEGPPADTLVIAPVGDYLHADNIAGATSKGTPLDLDTRMPKVIRTGVAVLRYAIENGLDRHKNVHVVITPGNHDEILSHCLTITLEEAYSKEPRVIIHNEPTDRHYMVWGNVLLGWIHGHKIKDQNIPLTVATERSKEWGETEFRYIFRGHHHHKSLWGVMEYNGAIVEQVRPLCPSDAYATGLGLMAGNDCMNITYHKEIGEVKRITASLKKIRIIQNNN